MNQLAPVQGKESGRASGPGYSITAAAKIIPMPRKRLQRAVDDGEVTMISFGGVKVLTHAEIERIRALYAITENSVSADAE